MVDVRRIGRGVILAIGAAGLIRVPRRTETEQADDAAQRAHRESLAALPRADERRHDSTPRAAETDLPPCASVRTSKRDDGKRRNELWMSQLCLFGITKSGSSARRVTTAQRLHVSSHDIYAPPTPETLHRPFVFWILSPSWRSNRRARRTPWRACRAPRFSPLNRGRRTCGTATCKTQTRSVSPGTVTEGECPFG